MTPRSRANTNASVMAKRAHRKSKRSVSARKARVQAAVRVAKDRKPEKNRQWLRRG
jgi:hypothetical protein